MAQQDWNILRHVCTCTLTTVLSYWAKLFMNSKSVKYTLRYLGNELILALNDVCPIPKEKFYSEER